MCMEDIRIGRELAAGPAVVTVTGPASVALIGSNPNRVRLFVSGDGATTVWIGPQGMTPANLTGIALTAGEPTFMARVEEWGKLITGPWTAFVQAGTVRITVVDAALERQ